jgi:hypothetical protein
LYKKPHLDLWDNRVTEIPQFIDLTYIPLFLLNGIAPLSIYSSLDNFSLSKALYKDFSPIIDNLIAGRE